MRRSVINQFARTVETALLNARLRQMTDEEMYQSAMIVAPHPDDETLGCGGTIIKKLRRGAAVHVVFTTDGGGSHRAMDREKLAATRMNEAKSACARLGVPIDNVLFLGFPDGELFEHEDAAAHQLLQLMEKYNPSQVFATYCHDKHPDHLATNRAVRDAMQRSSRARTLLEYPVWFWEHWPWMETPTYEPRRRTRMLRRGVMSPLRAMRDFRVYVDVADVKHCKRDALYEHATQMQPQGDKWTTLATISDGEFIDRMMTDREIFSRVTIEP